MARMAAEARVEPTRIRFVEALRLVRNEWEWLTVTSPGAIPKRLNHAPQRKEIRAAFSATP